MTWRIRRGFVIGGVAAIALAGCGSSGTGTQRTQPKAAGPRPTGPIVGVMFNGPVLGSGVNLGQQLNLAVASGVESLRVPAEWSAMQP